MDKTLWPLAESMMLLCSRPSSAHPLVEPREGLLKVFTHYSTLETVLGSPKYHLWVGVDCWGNCVHTFGSFRKNLYKVQKTFLCCNTFVCVEVDGENPFCAPGWWQDRGGSFRSYYTSMTECITNKMPTVIQVTWWAYIFICCAITWMINIGQPGLYEPTFSDSRQEGRRSNSHAHY